MNILGLVNPPPSPRGIEDDDPRLLPPLETSESTGGPVCSNQSPVELGLGVADSDDPVDELEELSLEFWVFGASFDSAGLVSLEDPDAASPPLGA